MQRWAPTNEFVDPNRLSHVVVDEFEPGFADQHRLSISNLVFRNDAAANDLFGRDAILRLAECPDELDAAARSDIGLEIIGAENASNSSIG